MKYLTIQNPPKQGTGATGDGFRRIIKKVKNDKGYYEYKETGKVNIYAKIQEAKDDTMISTILEKYKNGDIFSLNKKPANEYGDTTLIPNNINDLNNMSKSAGQKFQAMPDELKAKILSGENITQNDIINAFNLKTQNETVTETPKNEKGDNE